jgi:hypothetical protein
MHSNPGHELAFRHLFQRPNWRQLPGIVGDLGRASESAQEHAARSRSQGSPSRDARHNLAASRRRLDDGEHGVTLPRSARIPIRGRRINGAAHNQQLYADAFCTHGNLIADSILAATWNTAGLTFVNKMT